ncbi:MAG: sialidase family protein, partial [Verrucomicrobiota bacterium]
RDVPGKPLLDQMEVFFLRSADDGKTWDIILQVPEGMDKTAHPSGGLNETALIENDQGEIIALSRSQKEAHKMYLSISKDEGLTWSNPVDSGMYGLPPQMIKLNDGRILCTYGRRYAPTGIFARISNDGGHIWLDEEEIVINDRFPGNPNDNGYPISVQLDDGSIFTIYYKAGADGVISYIGGTHWRID